MRFPSVVVRDDVLQSWLTVSDCSKSRLAAELGVSKGRVSQLLTSREVPSSHLVAKLITLTQLPFDRLFKIIHTSPSPLRGSPQGKVARRGGGKNGHRNGHKNGHKDGPRHNGSVESRRVAYH